MASQASFYYKHEHWTWQFLAIYHNLEPRCITDYNHAFLLWSFYDVATNWWKKNIFTKPSIYEIIHLKVFFKNVAQIFFHQIQGLNLSISYSRPGHFGAISSICNRGPCAGLLLDGNMPACHRHFVLTLLGGRLQIIIANGKN